MSSNKEKDASTAAAAAEAPPVSDGSERESDLCAVTEIPEESALSFLRMASFEPLVKMSGRRKCPGCLGKRKWYCYDCFMYLGAPADLPQVSLPFRVDVVRHVTEKKSKSTAVHAAVLAPDMVRFHDYPQVPSYDYDEYLLVYPDPEAPLVGEVDPNSFKGVVFVDSQWHKANVVLRHDNLQHLRRVRMDSYETVFWRYQHGKGKHCLATIEAIYYFCREAATARNNGVYNGELDNLMWFYAYQYELIQNSYRRRQREFRHINDFLRPTTTQDTPAAATAPDADADTAHAPLARSATVPDADADTTQE